MASIMEELMDVLEKESVEYESLLELSKEKTPAIVAGKLEELREINDKEQDVVSRIQKLEHKREEVVKDIATVTNRNADTLKVTVIIEMLGNRPEEQKKLSVIHDRLKTAVNAVVSINNQNKTLIEHSLEMIEFDMNLFKSMRQAPEVANYNKGAYNTGGTSVVRGNFDTKQ